MTIALVGSSGSGRQRIGACAHPWQPRGSQLAVVATPAAGAPAGAAPTPGIAGQGRAPELPPELRPHRGRWWEQPDAAAGLEKWRCTRGSATTLLEWRKRATAGLEMHERERDDAAGVEEEGRRRRRCARRPERRERAPPERPES